MAFVCPSRVVEKRRGYDDGGNGGFGTEPARAVPLESARQNPENQKRRDCNNNSDDHDRSLAVTKAPAVENFAWLLVGAVSTKTSRGSVSLI